MVWVGIAFAMSSACSVYDAGLLEGFEPVAGVAAVSGGTGASGTGVGAVCGAG